MARPGTTLKNAVAAAARAARSRTGRWYIVDFTEKGPTVPTEVKSFAQFTSVFGAPVAWSFASVCAEVFFSLGGESLVVSRELGPTPVKSSLMLAGASGNTLKVEAKSAGAWGDGLQAEIVTSGSNRTLNVYDAASNLIASSGTQTTEQGLIDWSATSDFVNVLDQSGTGLPVAMVKTHLASGTDDHASATDTQAQAALDAIPASMGPGQVSMPGRTTSTVHAMLRAHAAANRRRAILDLVDTADKATLKTATAAERPASDSNRGAAFTPWVKIAGTAAGTSRTVPPSPFVAALMAVNDAAQSPNNAVAGENGTLSPYAQGLTVAWSEADMQDLSCPELTFSSHGSINVILEVEPGVIQIYGNRTLTDPVTNAVDLQLSNVRFDMAVDDALDRAAKTFVFKKIDGRGHLAGALNTRMTAVMRPWFDDDSLYGETEDDAYLVETGPQLNTAATAAAGQLLGQVTYVRSESAEEVTTTVIRNAVGTAIAA